MAGAVDAASLGPSLDRESPRPASSADGATRELHGDAPAAPLRPVLTQDRTAAGRLARPAHRLAVRAPPARPIRTSTMPDRFYLTTAIAYANNKPGLHTLYEVIGADVIARWHRMKGDDTRFLTGTDEHSVNIAQAAAARSRHDAAAFVDEKVALFKAAEDALGIAPTGSSGPPTPTTSGRPRRWSAGRTPTATSTSARTRAGTARTRASRRHRRPRDARGTICPNHPDVPLQWLTERNWFFRLSAYQERLERHFERPPGLRPARLPPQRDARLHPPGPRGLLDQPRADAGTGASRSRSPRTARPPSARTARGTRRPARSTSGSTR